MVSRLERKYPVADGDEPAWDIARLFPAQGRWDERDYLSLDTNWLVELTDGVIEVLAMPTPAHQRIVSHLSDLVRAFVRPTKRAEVLVAPMPIHLRSGKFREPDVMAMLAEHSSRKREKFWEGADLVMEVVSDDPASHERDHTIKRVDYAESGIPEYWIIDPADRKITVLSLHRGEYILHGEFGSAQIADSVLFKGFSVSVDEVFAAADEA